MDAEYDPMFEYERLLAQAYHALSQKHVYLMQAHSTNPNGYKPLDQCLRLAEKENERAKRYFKDANELMIETEFDKYAEGHFL